MKNEFFSYGEKSGSSIPKTVHTYVATCVLCEYHYSAYFLSGNIFISWLMDELRNFYPRKHTTSQPQFTTSRQCSINNCGCEVVCFRG